MDVLFECFVVGLIIGIPVWILMQYLRPRFRFARLPAFGGSLQQIHLEPVVLRGRFVASAAYLPNTASVADEAVVVEAADIAGAADTADTADTAVVLKPAP